MADPVVVAPLAVDLAAVDAVAVASEAMDRLIEDVPDYPEPGVVFKDITP